MRKKLGLALAAVMTMSTLAMAGCGGGNEDDPLAAHKDETILYVGVYEGGCGVDWIYKAKEAIEKRYEGISLEEGKTGLYIDIRPDKGYSGSSLSTGIASADREVYVTETFTAYNQLARQGYLLDITDIVTETLEGETKSIGGANGKMHSSYKDWFEIDGKFYGLPHAQAGGVISYDVDLFESKNFYFAENGVDFVTSKTQKRSAGPNGKFGDYDDGLPATYDDFYKLCNRIYGSTVTPLLWSGPLKVYVNNMTATAFVDYEGYDKAVSHFNYSGTIDVVTGFNGNEPIITSTTVSQADGYKTFQQPGLYYALQFLETIVKNDNWYDYNVCFGAGYDHLATQEQFVYSTPSPNIQDAAMIIEGEYWYNEALSAREACAEEYPTENERRFAVMPMPKQSKAKAGVPTLTDGNKSTVFIMSNIEEAKESVAKEFVQYLFTDESLSYYTSKTSLLCPYDYEMSEEDYEAMSYYGKSLYEMKKEGAKYVCALNQTDVMLKSPGLSRTTELWRTTAGNSPIETFNRGDKTAKEYFLALGEYYSPSIWTSNFA